MSARISRERLGRIAGELTPRDRGMIEMLARVKLANGHQLRRSQWHIDSEANRRAARRELARLVRWRVLARLERRQGGLGRGSDAWTYALDVAGQRLVTEASGARRPHLPGTSMWHHALTGAEVYTRVIQATRNTNRSLARWQGEPTAWRSYRGPLGERLLVKPDAFVDVAGPDFHDLAFLEIDTGSQSRTVIRQKLAAYRAYAATGHEQAREGGVFPLTVFITTTPERHAVLVDLMGELPPSVWPMFAVGQLDDAVRLLTGGLS